MSEVLLFCPEPLGLKLGPSPTPGEFIEFKDGFARFDSDDFPDWERWVKHPGTPHIEVLPTDSDQVPANARGAEHCPVCDRAFATHFALVGHLRSHAPKG